MQAFSALFSASDGPGAVLDDGKTATGVTATGAFLADLEVRANTYRKQEEAGWMS